MIEKNNKKSIKKYELISFLKSDTYYDLKMLLKKESFSNNIIDEITLESNMYLPLDYSVNDNCPTCGYRTPESHKRYNYNYIKQALFYKLDEIKKHDINTVNCYNDTSIKINEYNIIYKILDEYDVDINMKITTIEELELVKKYNFKSIIINPQDKEIFNYILNNKEITNNHEIILELDIYNPKTLESNIDLILDIKKYKIDYIDIKGYDPFIDNKQEYNPQYSEDYLIKSISIIRYVNPNIKLKIQYATNNNNFFNRTLKMGINTITGIYPYKNEKISNYNKVMEEIKSI